jgi:glycerophosphoryl diester phosphodiesterase
VNSNGTGHTPENYMDYLRSLDISYGYTSDGGGSYPLRGQGVGKMPSLAEVLDRFPQEKFLINFKSRDLGEADRLSAYLDHRSPKQRKLLMVYGRSTEMLNHFSSQSDVGAWASKEEIRACYTTIIASNGSDLGVCSGRVFGGPLELAEKIPGWPGDFITKVRSSGGEFYVMGIDSADSLQQLGENYSGGIWTDYIEVIGQMF